MLIRSAMAVAVAAVFTQSAVAQQGQQQYQQGQQQAQQGQQVGNTTVAHVRGQALFNANGERIGSIENVLLNRNDEGFLVLTRAGDQQRVLAPFDHLVWRDGRFVLLQAQQMNMQRYTEDMADNYQRLTARHRVRVAGYDRGAQVSRAEGADIVVRQPQPRVRIEQAQPSVQVQQPQPQVSVQQPQPQIIVRQPPPTITVEQRQPEIIVRMPDPNVDVSMPEPDVNVNVPPPQVRFAQPDREATNVRQAEPIVRVQPPQGQAQVDINRSQPQVRYERTGEPQIRYSAPQGEPQIQYERMGAAEQQEGAAAGGSAPQQDQQDQQK